MKEYTNYNFSEIVSKIKDDLETEAVLYPVSYIESWDIDKLSDDEILSKAIELGIDIDSFIL